MGSSVNAKKAAAMRFVGAWCVLLARHNGGSNGFRELPLLTGFYVVAATWIEAAASLLSAGK